jgi:hypothetical protein
MAMMIWFYSLMLFLFKVRHLLGFGKSSFGEEGVENFVFFADFIGFFIDHFQVGVDNFVIEPESKGKGPDLARSFYSILSFMFLMR